VQRDRAAARLLRRRPRGGGADQCEHREPGHGGRGQDDAHRASPETFRHPILLLRLGVALHGQPTPPLPALLLPLVTRSRAIPMARIASDATTPIPNWPRCRPCATA